MGNCLSMAESMNPRHHVSNLSSSPPREPSLLTSGDPVPPPTLMEPSQRSRSSGSTNPRHHGSTPSSPPTMEPSQPSPLDSVHPSPMDALELISETYEIIDPVEQPVEQTRPFKRLKSSESMNPCHHGSTPSSPLTMEPSKPSPVDSVRPVDPVEQIDPHMSFVENELQKAPSGPGSGSCSSEGWLETVLDDTKLDAKTIDTISTEAEKLSDSDAVEEATGSPTLKRGKSSRFWLPTKAGAQLEKTNQPVGDVRDCLGSSVGFPIPEQSTMALDFQWRKDYEGAKDVFLSHNGKQKYFVRHLHRDLTKEHVSCFFEEDDNSLPLAQKFPYVIFKAAETCKIAVVVLSKEFICSKWSMHELCAFIKAKNSGQNAKLKLLPIFFMISPKELSHITKDSLEWQKLGESEVRRSEWQDALKVVRTLNGLQLGEDGNELDFRDKVVKAIRCFLNPPRLLDFEPVGIEKQVREVKALLDMEGAQSALAVIVCGFGGVGKSTLAASVVDSLDWPSMDFKFCRVEIDEKTPDKISHIMKLQKNVLYYLGGDEVYLRDPHDGRLQIKKALKKKFSLLFIDNVVDKDYIRDLLPQDLQSGEEETKLRIIITSRDKNVKAELNIICNEYEVKGLSDADSERLLVETIMQSQMIEEDEKRMINEVAVECRGVPLLLSVFGKHLRVERNKESYQEALDVLREGNLDSYRDEDLGTKLMYVYHKIKNVEVKEAFLDICTYFNGWKWNLVADIVDLPILKDLHSRMLVSRSGSDEVIVHDILRLMGMKEARLSRFSNYKALSDALEDSLDGFGNVKGISLVSDNHLITIRSTQLEAMHRSLRVLMLGDWVTLDGPPCYKAFRNLRYLRVGDITAFPFKDLAKLDKLRVFLNRSKPGMNLSHLPSSLKHISNEVPLVKCDEFANLPFQNLRSLKSFSVKTGISWKSVKLPKALHLPASLVDLDLRDCRNLPKDIGHLTALESLILDRSDLNGLPQGFGNLKKLKHLSMNYCSKLAFLSEELGMLSSLKALSIEGCQILEALPESFGELCISSFKLNSLSSLNELPNSFGNMPLLKDLSLESCDSLISLPDSFVQLKILETLKINYCPKLSILPEDFGRLRCLKHMTVEGCHLLKELPHGFGALPALETFEFKCCNGFVSLPRDFTELTSLEEIRLESLPLKRIPDGFGKLKRLRFLFLKECLQLKTLSDDFENMANLERLRIRKCPELEGTMMEKILNLQNCSMADIEGSTKLVEKWKQMQSEIEYPISVFSGDEQIDREVEKRAIMVALLKGKCVEVNMNGQLMERSSLLVGLKEGTSATVALIILPFQMCSDQHQTLQRIVEMARETAKTNGSGMLQIVCARKYVWTARRPLTDEEERAEKEDIRQILLSMPMGSCASSKRIDYGDDSELNFFIGHVVVDMEGQKRFDNFEVVMEYEIPKNVFLENKDEDDNDNSIQNFIKSICYKQSQYQSVQRKTREFIQALKGNGIHHLVIKGQQVMVDDLHGKTIGFIICNLIQLEWIKLTQICKYLHQDSNFIAISIPTDMPEYSGHGSYTRLSQGMPWATIPHPQDVHIAADPRFVVLDKEGQIANQDAWGLLLGWGFKFYPFTEHSIRESFFMMESQSLFEILFHGMDIVGRKPMKSKMTFLYAAYPSEWVEMKCKLEQLSQIDGDFEVLYVGKLAERDWEVSDIEDFKQEYEDAIQNMSWPSLSVSDWIMFWYRCRYFATNEYYRMAHALHGLADEICNDRTSLVLVDNDGVLTRRGEDVVEMICDISNGEGMDELSRGELLPFVKTCFGDEIDNHPLHPQHRLSLLPSDWGGVHSKCDVCLCMKYYDNEKRSYRCAECRWHMCGSCWMAYAKQHAQQLMPAKQLVDVEQLCKLTLFSSD